MPSLVHIHWHSEPEARLRKSLKDVVIVLASNIQSTCKHRCTQPRASASFWCFPSNPNPNHNDNPPHLSFGTHARRFHLQ